MCKFDIPSLPAPLLLIRWSLDRESERNRNRDNIYIVIVNLPSFLYLFFDLFTYYCAIAIRPSPQSTSKGQRLFLDLFSPATTTQSPHSLRRSRSNERTTSQTWRSQSMQGLSSLPHHCHLVGMSSSTLQTSPVSLEHPQPATLDPFLSHPSTTSRDLV
jgi:hypothetical protein